MIREEANLNKLFKFILKKYQILQEQLKSALVSDTNSEEAEMYSEQMASFGYDSQIPAIKARITNYNKLTKIKQLKTSMIEKFVCLNGTVSRISNIKPFLTRLAFECNKCQSTFVIETKSTIWKLNY